MRTRRKKRMEMYFDQSRLLNLYRFSGSRGLYASGSLEQEVTGSQMERELCYSFLSDLLHSSLLALGAYLHCGDPACSSRDMVGYLRVSTDQEGFTMSIKSKFLSFTCYQKGHKKFYYVFNSRFPGEHAYWCGRCGYESSDEKDRRDIRVEPIF